MIGSNEFLMLLLNDINLGGSPASNSFSSPRSLPYFVSPSPDAATYSVASSCQYGTVF